MKIQTFLIHINIPQGSTENKKIKHENNKSCCHNILIKENPICKKNCLYCKESKIEHI